MSTNNSQVQTQPAQQDEVKTSAEAQARASSPKQHNKSDQSDGVLHVAAEMKNSRQKIGYLFAILKTERPVTLKAYGSAIGKAIRIATVVRSKVGGLHQLVRLTESNDEKRATQGIEIVLSASQLDQEAVGYQAPEAKGFWVPKKRPEAKKEKADEAEAKKAAEADKKDADDKSKKKRRQNRKKSASVADKPKDEAAVVAEASAEAKADPAPAKEESSKSAKAKQRRNKRQRRPKTAEKEAEAKENAKPARENSAGNKKDADHKEASQKADKAPKEEKQFEGGQGARSRKHEQMKYEPRQQMRYPPQGNGRRPDFFRNAYPGGGGYYPYQQYQPLHYRQNYSRYFAGENGRAPYQGMRGGYRQNPTSYGGGGRPAPDQRRELTKWSEGRQQQQE